MAVTSTEDRSVMLIGGELIEFSDLEGGNTRGPLGGPVVGAVVEALVRPGDTVLLAGTYPVELVSRVAETAGALDVLVRSYPDAEKLAASLPDRSRVYAGGLDRFGAEHGRSAYDVVVALDGVDRLFGPDSTDLNWTEAVAALRARAADRFAIGVPNPIGLHRLVHPEPVPSRDDEWPRRDTGLPGGFGAIQAALPGLTAYPVFPDVEHPALLVGVPGLPAAPDLVAATMATGQHEPLTDPYRLTRETLAAGLGAELAPGWFLITDGVSLPELIGGTEPVSPERLTEERLLAACRQGDQLEIRRLIESYAEWLRTTGMPVSDGLARIAARLKGAGVPLPWPGDQLAGLFGAIAGVPVPDPELEPPAGYAEAVGTISRLTGELADVRGQVRGLEAELAKVRGSVALRVGRMVTAPLKAVYRTLGVRQLVRRIRNTRTHTD